MRFIAAFSVVMYHYTARNIDKVNLSYDLFNFTRQFTKFGYLGVNLFFIISGFVILASAIDRSWYEFCVSRFTRLYPTYWLCVTFTAIAVILFHSHNHSISYKQYFSNLTMLNDYFGVKDLDGVYWTLQVELKFYCCIFVLILFDWLRHYKVWISLWLIATISFIWFDQPFFMGWFITPYYSSYFIAGTAFYLVSKNGYDKYFAIIICLSLVISSAYTFKQAEGFISNPQIQDRIFAISIVWIFYFLFYLVSIKKLRLKFSYFIFSLGGITYPLYLLHSRVGKAIFDHYVTYLNPYFLVCSIILLMLTISFLIHKYFEKIISLKIKERLLTYSIYVKER